MSTTALTLSLRNPVSRLLPAIALTAGLLTACGSPEPTASPPAGGGGDATPSPTPTVAETVATPTPTEAGFDADAYFRGRTISIVDGFAPGGGSDTVFRMFALTAPKYFPGSPRFVIQNLPGGGGLRGVQHVVRANPDGLVMGGVHARWPKRAVAGVEVEGFDPFAVKWIGRAYETVSEPAIYVRRSVASTWQEVQDKGITLRYGATEPGHGGDLAPAFIEHLGGPVQIIYGYGGSAEVLAAVDREELDATGFAGESFVRRLYPEWLEERFVVPVLWWGTPHRASYLEALGAPEPPYVFDLIQVEDWQQETFEISNDLDRISMAFFLPEDTPDHIHQVWLDAFAQIVEDEEFKQRKIAANFEPTFVTAEEVTRILEGARRVVANTPEAQEVFRVLLGLNE